MMYCRGGGFQPLFHTFVKKNFLIIFPFHSHVASSLDIYLDFRFSFQGILEEVSRESSKRIFIFNFHFGFSFLNSELDFHFSFLNWIFLFEF